MLGAIIGDVVGSRFEFNNIKSKNFKLVDKDSTFTDDSVLTIAVMDWLLHAKAKCNKTAVEYLQKWARKYPNAGYGGMFYHWKDEENPKPYNSCGNGSAMRVSPVAWAYDNPTDVKEEAEKTAAVSHNHPEGIKGAVAVAHAIWLFRTGWGKSLREWCDTMQQYYPGFESQHFEHGRFDETCQGTVPLCLQIIAQSQDFEDAIRRAISFGGDSDTIGAIVGSIAEARWGIPDNIYAFALGYLHFDMLEVIKKFNNFINNK
jgi:ADP-ribosylglycohydrolase